MVNRIKFTVVFAAASLLLLAGSYVYSLWAENRKYNDDLPFDASAAMMRDLLRFHEKSGRFPENLKELEGPVWEKKEREIDPEGRVLKHRNYYYLYTRVSSRRSTLWAIPTGELREEGPTWYLDISPEETRRWKGPAVPIDQVDGIEAEPTLPKLGAFGLTEQPAVLTKAKRSK